MSTLSLNVGNFITLKLTPTNYPLWREQALSLAESQDLVESISPLKTQPLTNILYQILPPPQTLHQNQLKNTLSGESQTDSFVAG